jgi:hypothetical protein
MNRLWLIGIAACAFALASTLSVTAMPIAAPNTLGTNDAIIQVRGGHGHGWGHGHGRGHHYGWWRGRGHHYGWRHHHHWR